MPEGHTLRRLADDLTAAFAGATVSASSPQGRFGTEAAVLDGTRLLAADAAGKHLFVEFEHDHVVHVHLGLIGGFAVTEGAAEVPPPVGQVRLRLVARTGPGRWSYADLRGATRCDLVTGARRDEVLAGLGPDPLRPDADPTRAWERVHRSARPIGELLMQQDVIAGVGNVYRAEVLFRQRIDPFRPGRTLRRSRFLAIWEDLVGLMADGVRLGRIDTVRPEHTPEAMGRPAREDDHGGEVYVYRRSGQPCLVCGTLVRTSPMAGRNLFWCGQCQRRFRSRAVQ
ncbi:Fpg/Nei family DNA glycosylase [Nocardioides sp.]|uniref:Fpg/Nei family DNA glycosylase n=1 Tax=Nocardioides sp. TaxID=35761 RepID=UPI0035277E91